MGIVKPTEAGQNQRLEHLKALRDRRLQIHELAQLKDSPGWSSYKKLINSFIETEERRLKMLVRDAGRHFDNQDRPILSEHIRSDINASVAIKETYDLILSVVDSSEEKIIAIDVEIKKYEEKFKEAQKILS